MKKSLFLVMACFALFSACSSLKIAINTVDNDGKHTICTSDISLFGHFDIAMGMQVSEKDTLMGIVVTCDKNSDHGVFQKGERLMIRFVDGSEMALTNVYDREFDKETTTQEGYESEMETRLAYAYSPWTGNIYLAPVTYHALVPYSYTSTVTKSYALYLVTRQQMHEMLTKQAIKVRVEIESADCDMPHPENFNSRITKLHEFLLLSRMMQRSEF